MSIFNPEFTKKVEGKPAAKPAVSAKPEGKPAEADPEGLAPPGYLQPGPPYRHPRRAPFPESVARRSGDHYPPDVGPGGD